MGVHASDGNADGNPGRRARSRLNAHERVARVNTAEGLDPLQLETSVWR
jgi:hypothetical protein